MPVISLRGLNRTLLQRQLLAERASDSPLGAIRRLVAMQGQEPNWPYVGLWTRLADFRPEDLGALLHGRDVVRSTMVRRTMHLADAEDFRWLRPTVQPFVGRGLRSSFFTREIDGIDLAELARAGRELLSGRPLSRRELARRLTELFPGRHGARLVQAVELMVALVHTPDAGTWGRWGNRSGISVALADEWIGRPLATAPQVETLILRYLAAFGPADVMDVQAWSGLTRLREVVDGLRPRLRVVRDEQGRALYDLPDAPLADPDLPVPVRFLPAFDNALLGHRDRTRVISDEDRGRFARVASGGVPVFLVDGFAAGTWSLGDSGLSIAPFRPLPQSATTAVLDEGERLLAFTAPEPAAAGDAGATDRSITVVSDGSPALNRLQPGPRKS